MIELRDYQQECLAAIQSSAARGVKRQLVALPTGTGKTVIFSQMPERIIQQGKRVMVIPCVRMFRIVTT